MMRLALAATLGSIALAFLFFLDGYPTVIYDSFLTAAPNYSYPYLIPLNLPLGNASLTALQVTQTGAASGPLSNPVGGAYAFSLGAASGPVQTQGAKFAGNEVRLVCGAFKCAAQVLVSGASRVLGSIRS